MILPGSRIPDAWLPFPFGIAPGYSLRQDEQFVYLAFGAEDILFRLRWRNHSPEELWEKIIHAIDELKKGFQVLEEAE